MTGEIRIAVCLMTCDRPEYTRRTVESFLDQNPDRSRFVLLHGDDASVDDRNEIIAGLAGFRMVVDHRVRCGNLALRFAMIEAAAHFAKWVLILENDMESVRPFPWPLFDFVAEHKKIYCLRLFGQYKDAAGVDPCKTTHQWKRNRPVKWFELKRAPEPAQYGSIHWSAQPSVTRVRSAIALHRKGPRELGWTARVRENVFVHIGAERTQPPAPTFAEALTC